MFTDFNWADFNLLGYHVKSSCPVSQEECWWTRWPQQGPSLGDERCFPCISLMTRICFLIMSNEKQQALVSLCFISSWPHALIYVFPSTMPETTKFNSSNSWGVGVRERECAQWSMGWSSWERCCTMYLDEMDSHTVLSKETHTQAHRALFCAINSGAGSHKAYLTPSSTQFKIRSSGTYVFCFFLW